MSERPQPDPPRSDHPWAGEFVDVATPDGVADAYLSQPAGAGPHPGVLVYMNGIGLRPELCAMADRIARHGYAVLLPNAFYRHGRAPLFALPDPDDEAQWQRLAQEHLGPMMAALTPDLAVRDAGAYLDHLAATPAVRPGPVGVVGYCMGGGLAVRTAAAYPERVAAAASFHGANLATDAPDSPHLGAARIRAELYFGHADADPWLPPEQIDRLDRALREAAVRFQAEVYPGARHGFTMADMAPYDAAAADRHWTRLLALLDRTLH